MTDARTRSSRPASTSRRDFLRIAGGAAAAPFLGTLSGLALGAGPFTDYRALVCVFLFGGNDAHNLFIPLDGRFATYTTNRGPLALPRSSLDATTVNDTAQGAFAFHPRLTRASALFRAGRLAVVSNVGPLLQPTTRSQFDGRVSLPPQLFSHNDMFGHWFTAHPQVPTTTGWGGRLADVFQSANAGTLSASIATAGSNVFFKGAATSAYTIVPYAAGSTIVSPVKAYRSFDTTSNTQGTFQNAIAIARSNLLEAQYARIVGSTFQNNAAVLDAVYSTDSSGALTERRPLSTVFPSTGLGNQLRSVAMTIAARQNLGVKRQVFFVSLGGFDTHSDQFDVAGGSVSPGPNDPPILFGKHAELLTQLDNALNAFYDATVELGVANSVTTFTGSDFGRTLTSNGLGSDHGWGGHHLVLGGAVRGGQIVGAFHNMQVGSGNPLDSGQGRLIPDLSVDQYAATMAKWMGANTADLAAVFPNLANFSQPDLGFMA